MKPLPLGKSGAEQPGLLDSGGQLRELSAILTDIAGSSLLPESLDKLGQLNPQALPLVSGSPRLGPCVGSGGKVQLHRPHIFGSSGYLASAGARSRPPTVKLDRMDVVLFVPESSSRTFHPLDLGIERFAGGIRSLMCGSQFIYLVR